MNMQGILFSEAAAGTIGEKAVLSLTTLILGMLTVFSVLLIIMIVLVIIGAYFKKKDQKAQKQKALTPSAPSAPETVPDENPVETDEGELVAAITAAVAMCMEEPVGSFRVVSFRKTSTKPAWTKK